MVRVVVLVVVVVVVVVGVVASWLRIGSGGVVGGGLVVDVDAGFVATWSAEEEEEGGKRVMFAFGVVGVWVGDVVVVAVGMRLAR